MVSLNAPAPLTSLTRARTARCPQTVAPVDTFLPEAWPRLVELGERMSSRNFAFADDVRRTVIRPSTGVWIENARVLTDFDTELLAVSVVLRVHGDVTSWRSSASAVLSGMNRSLTMSHGASREVAAR